MNLRKQSLKSQTATEYLIVLAIVIIIALVVIGALGGIPSIGIGVSENSVKAKLKTLDVSIDDYALTKGGMLFKVRNSKPFAIQLNSLSVGGFPCNPNVILKMGQSTTIFCPYIYEKKVDTKFKEKINLTYTDLDSNAVYSLDGGDIVGTTIEKINCKDGPAGYFSGKGTKEDPYTICSCTQFQAISQKLTSHFQIISDIDCNETRGWWNAAKTKIGGFNSIGNFAGNLNGNGFSIKNIYANRTSDYTGIIGNLYGNVSNLKIVNPVFNFAKSHQGILTSTISTNGIVSNVSVENFSITLFSSSGSTPSTVGGIAGRLYQNGILKNSNSYGTFYGSIGYKIGGLVGAILCDINCFVNNTYSNITVVGSLTDRVGCLFGTLETNGLIYNSYSFCNSKRDIGTRYVLRDYNSFSDTDIYIEGNNYFTSKSTSEMKTKSTFTDAGWDFVNVWNINSKINSGYPYLRWAYD